MRWILITLAAAALAAGCDNAPETSKGAATPASPPQASSGSSSTPSTPANAGAPKSQEEKREGANPVQGQVDPKASEQRKDFQQKGDARGPTSPDTKPKTGG